MIPPVKKFEAISGKFKLAFGKIFTHRGSFKIAKLLCEELSKFGLDFSIVAHSNSGSKIELLEDRNVVHHEQGYRIIVRTERVSIVAGSDRGLFYAIQTFKQLLREHGFEIPCLFIEDEPDFENRGFMLDISRDRVPKLETLKKLVDLLCELKFNQLQLYMEHTFAYEKHEKVWKDYSPLTHGEVMELDEYCRERFIELVPNQNCFGHLEKWLAHEDYKHLAECPDGFIFPWGTASGPFSLSPAVPDSLKFVEELLDELLPHFSSSKVNVGADETFDLGLGRSKELCEKFGKGRVYLNFLLSLYKIARKHGRTMMFWGDIIKNHPELVAELPKDIVALIWGYEEAHPYWEECALFAGSGVPFYVCPGTSSWNSFVGRIDNALKNIENAIQNGKKHGAIGFLLTDWGDNGHPQHLPISIVPIAHAASLGWNGSVELSPEKLLEQTDVHIFKSNVALSRKLYVLGNLYKKVSVQIPNASMYFLTMMLPERFLESIKAMGEEDIKKMRENIEQVEVMIQQLRSIRDKTDLESWINQIINNAEMLRLSMEWIVLMNEHKDIEKIPRERWGSFEEEFEHTLKDYEKLWLELNKPGGLKQSAEKLARVLNLRTRN
ncbi:MAG: family 20 glycosylhydrolase [Pseudothermotoga sp.]|nr:family 20 glycosylhydrolase [Pseudothermotoga sp.]